MGKPHLALCYTRVSGRFCGSVVSDHYWAGCSLGPIDPWVVLCLQEAPALSFCPHSAAMEPKEPGGGADGWPGSRRPDVTD